MARRGTSKTAKTASDRTAARRADLIAKGYAQKNLLLSPDALTNLSTISARDGCHETEAAERALAFFATRQMPELTNARLLKLIGARLRPEFG